MEQADRLMQTHPEPLQRQSSQSTAGGSGTHASTASSSPGPGASSGRLEAKGSLLLVPLTPDPCALHAAGSNASYGGHNKTDGQESAGQLLTPELPAMPAAARPTLPGVYLLLLHETHLPMSADTMLLKA